MSHARRYPPLARGACSGSFHRPYVLAAREQSQEQPQTRSGRGLRPHAHLFESLAVDADGFAPGGINFPFALLRLKREETLLVAGLLDFESDALAGRAF